MRMLPLAVLLVLACPTPGRAGEADGPNLPVAAPEHVGMDPARLAWIDGHVRASIARGECPGAVVVVIRQGKVVFRKAYGDKSVAPGRAVMALDTVFDLASLTKPIATATAVMTLVERGRLRLEDEVGVYLPLPDRRKWRVTVADLLTHTSGLTPDNDIADYRDGPDKAWERLFRLEPQAEPGSQFRYSDVGFLWLGKIVEKASGRPLDVFTREEIFAPLGMADTGFRPGPELARRAAPTEKRGGEWLRGEVHDPRAHLLGGVAGHAGLFSTADDLAVYAQMLLGGGEFAGRRVLSPAAVRLMTEPRPVPGGQRSLGWDVATAYSSNRGELFAGGFGHTGFTGTSLWVHPPSATAVIVLTNRVHPDGRGSVVGLRNRVATAVAASIVRPPFARE